MGPTRSVSGQKREPREDRFPFEGQPQPDPDALALAYLRSQCGALFRRGFQLLQHRRQLYVRTEGTKIPLRLDLAAGWKDVQARCAELQLLLEQGPYDPVAWDRALGREGVVLPRTRRQGREELISLWRRLKLAEGCSLATFQNSYEVYLRRLDERTPLREDSLLRAIESLPPTSPRRRRVVRFLRQVTQAAGVRWNSALLDPLEGAGRSCPKRETPFFSDEEIEAIVLGFRGAGKLGWWRATALMAIYGLRPWEAWIAVPDARDGCVWIGEGKRTSRGVNPPRTVPPFHREWLETFAMAAAWDQPMPRTYRSTQIGSMVTTALNRSGLLPDDGKQRSSYGFRHAYARRMHSPRYRVTDAHGALFMGHTVSVHNRAYRGWIAGSEDPWTAYGLDAPTSRDDG